MPAITSSRYMVTCGWENVPHLDPQTQQELLDSTPPYLRDARSKGTPSLGAGAIYPFQESDILVDPFAIPDFWPRGFGLDVGWKKTAALFGAHDRDTDTIYIYAEHYQGEMPPSTHAAAIRARGAWLPGVIDPASRGRQQRDGQQLIHDYRELGLDLLPATNSVESGLYAVLERFASGRLKIFRTCQNTVAEWRLYRRDEKGKVVKEFDHAMDALRYLIVSGVERMIIKPVKRVGTGPRRSDRYVGY